MVYTHIVLLYTRILVSLVLLLGQGTALATCNCAGEPAGARTVTSVIAIEESCCAGMTPSQNTTSRDNSERTPCQDDDCPRACCVVIKVLADTSIRQDHEPFDLAVSGSVVRYASSTGSPHLCDLERPPRLTITV